MPKFCPSCGSELQFQEAEICPKCGVRIKEPPRSSDEISKNVLIISYIGSALMPLLGLPLCIYCLYKGKILHFIGIAAVSVFMFFFWLGFLNGLTST
jgi:uncharacterized membrane protein YvbJ